jgi:transposase-like protein
MPAPSDPPAATSDAASNQRKRWSSHRKVEIVIRLLRGESLDLLSRETGVSVGHLAGWREEFLAAGEAALKSRGPEPAEVSETERRATTKVGELTLEIELLRQKITHMEAGLPPALRRSKR